MADQHQRMTVRSDEMADSGGATAGGHATAGQVTTTGHTTPDHDWTDERVTVTRTPATPRPMSAMRRGYREHDADEDVDIPRSLNLSRDRVRWGPIVAGLVTALTSLLLLGLLGVAIGLTVVNAGTAAAQGGPPPDTGRNSAIWAAISGILSFLLGGYVAGRTAAVFDRKWGALNGALVFLLGVPVTLWLASMGLGTVLGSLGGFASGLNADPGQAQNAAQQARDAAANVQPIDVARAAERTRNAAWGALGGSLLGLGSAALGGYLGTRRELEIDRETGHVAES